jgi:Fur family ferric uptake transcriptional regulator
MSEADITLHEKGYRLTPQRYIILRVIEEAKEHLTVEQITERVQERSPYINLSTVYRTLQLLQELGLVHETRFPDKAMSYYEVATKHEHYHFLCRRCQTIHHFDQSLLGKLPAQLQTQYHVHDLAFEVLATGYCNACWEAIQQEKNT